MDAGRHVLGEMQACGLTSLRSDRGRRPPRAEGEPQIGEEQTAKQVEKGEVIYLGQN
jgi:hypothetical protein